VKKCEESLQNKSLGVFGFRLVMGVPLIAGWLIENAKSHQKWMISSHVLISGEVGSQDSWLNLQEIRRAGYDV